MRRCRGKPKGEKLTPTQYANDYIIADREDGSQVVVSPRSVQLDPEDHSLFDRENKQVDSGSFWFEWELLSDGRFNRRPR